ncbi:hypothetical protein HAZT_HAZT011043 [Hyalella azteca]|uniref:alpha-L-fucosidase n=1 Tax=Hyalella azteca TaxID=294128 RepID=A0A6A0H974_HYAAZ|nr:hypothetical protein HAZT_HAZT011043 [Hyalella azteca]
MWSDGDWEAPDSYWNSTGFLSWLFNDSPVKQTVVVNDRWGQGTICQHGSFYTCHDRYNPGTLQPHKWENCMTLDRLAWGYRRNAPATDILSTHDLLTQLTQTVSCGGNLLVNAGPTPEGTIPPIMEERLRQMGTWLSLNGEAIYATSPWGVQNDTFTPGVWYTSTSTAVYALVLTWPADDLLTLGSVSSTVSTSITALTDRQLQRQLQFKEVSKGLQIALPPQSSLASQWVWVLKMRDVLPVQQSPLNQDTFSSEENYKENYYAKLIQGQIRNVFL